ncbi:MAG: ABC transporter permease [Elusimicrobiaceae bacterium]|nr:ABC transporter permease [Elusimicrobiaceae bacterium]
MKHANKKNYEFFIAKRYLKTKRKGLFAIITTIIAITGVAVGVAALLTTLAVMSGFQNDIRSKVIGAQSHILLFGRMSEKKYKNYQKEIEQLKKVSATAPNIYGQAILNYNQNSIGVVIRGMDTKQEKNINNLHKSLLAGSFSNKKNDTPWVVLGEELAFNMGIDIDDNIILISPKSMSSGAGVIPKMKKFRVSGLIKTGYYEFDNSMAYMSLKDSADFMGIPNQITGIAIKLHNLDDAQEVKNQIREIVGNYYVIRTFEQLNSTLYAALKLEKVVMFIILSLIILVASLNIASNLILLGTEKLKDIGILRAMGAKPKNIKKIFLYEGFLIATTGIFSGIALGFLLCFIIDKTNIISLPGDIYYITKVPIKIGLTDLLYVVFGSYALCFLAALYPAIRASKVEAVDAIRYG